MEREQHARFERAVERKKDEAEQRSRRPGGERTGEDPSARGQEDQLAAHERPQDVVDPRTKGSGHGQKTADKWNQ
jgi:hypothetical protein